jgi:hypothetical protein
MGLREGNDYNRITLSGKWGPVHWKDEQLPAIVTYDFRLSNLVSREHLSYLQFRTGTVLASIMKWFNSGVAFLPSGRYRSAFGPVVRAHHLGIAGSLKELGTLLS